MSNGSAIGALRVLGALVGMAVASPVVTLLALPATAQQANPAGYFSGEFERPFGFSPGAETQAYDANTRDGQGNRVILDGRIMTGSDLSSLSYASGQASASAWAQASSGAGVSGAVQGSAIGNQLNVITQGNYNTVVVNATQTNTGNQNTVLNGGINLD